MNDEIDNQDSKSKMVLTSLDPSCNELKHAYDSCFNGWFTDTFLRGSHKGTDTPCDQILKLYTSCVKTALKTKNIELNKLSDIKKPEMKSTSDDNTNPT